MVIAHNMAYMNAQRQFNIVEDKRKKSTEKLSSGLRVNRAADDAAGLAISEKLRRQIRGLSQGSENMQSGVSYCQVADGALTEIHDILHRMTELSVKSANGTNDYEDRKYIDEEFQQLKQELNRAFETTTYNDQRIWDDSQVVVNTRLVDEEVTDTYPAVVFNSISRTYCYTNNANSGAMPKTSFKLAANDDGIKVSWTGYDGINYETNNIPWDATLTGSHSFKLSDYMDYSKYPAAQGIDFTYPYTVNQYSTKQQVIDSFNSSYSWVNTGISNGVDTVVSYNDPSKDKVASFGASINYGAQYASGKDYNAYDTAFIEFSSIRNPADPAVSDSSTYLFEFDMAGIGKVKTIFSSGYYSGLYSSSLSDKEGENVWYTVRYNSTTKSNYKSRMVYSIPNGSLNSIMTSITNTDGHSLWTDNSKGGGSLSLSFILKADNAFTLPDGTTSTEVGKLSMSISIDKSKAATQDDLVSYITNALANITAVDISDNDGAGPGYCYAYRSSDSKSAVKATNTYTVKKEVHDYVQLAGRDLYIQSGTESGHGIHLEYDNMNAGLLGLGDTDVLTEKHATDAIDAVKSALAKVSEQRSLFGAYQNRMEHTIANLDNIVENTTEADSRIRDTDVAEETVKLSTSDILSQAGIAMMTQANQTKQGVMKLLG